MSRVTFRRTIGAAIIVAVTACGTSQDLSLETACSEVIATYNFDTDDGLMDFAEDLARLNGGTLTLELPTFAVGYCRANPGWTLGLALSQDTSPPNAEALDADPLGNANPATGSPDASEKTESAGESAPSPTSPTDVGELGLQLRPNEDVPLAHVVELVDDAMSAFDDAQPAYIDADAVHVVVGGVTRSDTELITNALLPTIVGLHPVVVCDGGEPDTAFGEELLPRVDGLGSCVVGPAMGAGELFSRDSAEAATDQTGQWTVTVDLLATGQFTWNAIATECFQLSGQCPSGQLAIVVDGVIQSAPTVQAPDFPGSLEITGQFTQAEAEALAKTFNRGAFPVTLTVELSWFQPSE